MAGSVNAGSIVYEVDLDTARLLAGRREVDAALNGMSGSMNRIEASTNRTERSLATVGRTMSSLTNVAKGLAAALSVQQVTEYANAWVTVSNKLVNSVKANEDLATVTQRVFDVSQDTRSSLEATATLYGRLERATRSAGTSTADLVKLTETINKGLTVSGATTEEASSTMTQLSQALASGVLRGEEFNSISENGSRLAQALAASLGVTIGQLRGMAAQGKLTTEVVVNGLLKQGDQIAKEFSNTTLTMGQAFTVATNNITKFVGEASSVNTTLNVFNGGVITLSENLGVVANVVAGAAVIFGGRFVGALAAATAAQATSVKSTLQGIAATRVRAREELAAASVTQRKAVADRGAALSALEFAQVEYQVAKGSAAEAFALENVIRLRGIYVQSAAAAALANNTLSASQAKVAATGLTMANAMTALKAVTAPLGGPIGVIAIVAAGWYLYAQKQAEARKESIAFADTLPDVIRKLKEMNLAQAQGIRADTVTSIKNQKDEIADLQSHIADLNKQYNERITLAKQMGGGDEENNGHLRIANELANDLAKANRDLDSKTRTLANSQDALRLVNIQVNQGIVDQMKAARDNAIAVKEAEKNASFLGQTHSFLAEKLGLSTTALQKFNSESLKINWGGSDGEKLIKQAERRLALSKLEGEARARLQATYDAQDAGTTDPLAIKRLQDMYAETERVTQGRKDQKKEDKSAAAEGKKLENQQESIAQKLANLKQQSEMAAGSTQELSRTQAMLRAEQSLGKGATQAQIDLARQYAAASWDVGAALKAQALIPEIQENKTYSDKKSQLEALKTAKDAQGNLLISQQQYNQQSAQLEQDHATQMAQIRANQVVTPQQEAAGTVDPVQQLANENAKKLALIQQFEANKTITEQQGLELRRAANKQYEQERTDAMFALWSQQTIGNQVLAASIESFSQAASGALSGVITGTQSASDAMRGLADTVLNSVIQTFVEMGLQQVKSAIMGATAQQAAIAATTTAQVAGISTQTAASTTAAVATTAAWTPAAIMSSVASFGGAVAIGLGAMAGIMALSGKRKNGGPVSAGGMYQVGEGGMPEIYQSSSGRQYMIPGDNGSVISNKDMQGGGGVGSGGVMVNINNYTPATVDMQQSTSPSGGITVDVFIADMNAGGPMSQSITSNTSATRRANNQ